MWLLASLWVYVALCTHTSVLYEQRQIQLVLSPFRWPPPHIYTYILCADVGERVGRGGGASRERRGAVPPAGEDASIITTPVRSEMCRTDARTRGTRSLMLVLVFPLHITTPPPHLHFGLCYFSLNHGVVRTPGWENGEARITAEGRPFLLKKKNR